MRGNMAAHTCEKNSGKKLPRRFYSSVTAEKRNTGWCILLDGRPLLTPQKQLISLPSKLLAFEIVKEWDAQRDVIDPAAMPITCLVNTGIDMLIVKATEVRDEIVRFADCDLLCYRVEHPQGLVERQNTAWNGALAWLSRSYSVHLQIVNGVMPFSQPVSELNKFRALLDDVCGLELTALHVVDTLTGSAVLGFGVLDGEITPKDAWTASQVDEDWQIMQWGINSELELKRQLRWAEFKAATEVMKYIRGCE